jgi:hypothetical protein
MPTVARWSRVAGTLVAAGVAVSAVAAAGTPVLAAPAPAAAAAPAASSPDWTATPLPQPTGALQNTFRPLAISCSSATSCFGGGSYRDSGFHQRAALLTWTGTNWTAAQAPLPADADSQLHLETVASVSCPSATSCFAGGHYRQKSPGGNAGLLLTLSGGTWTAAAAPLPANANPGIDASVNGMSCRSANWCTAVGQYDVGNVQYGLLLRWSDQEWTATAAPVAAGSEVITLSGVSCPSVARCFAVGSQLDALDNVQPIMLTWWKKQWSVVNIALPADAATNPEAVLGGVSCPAARRCIAAGSYIDSAGNTEGVLLSGSGKTWTAQTAPMPANAGANPWALLNAVSCPTRSRCTVGGTYEDASSTPLGLILNRTGKTWTATEAPASAYNLKGVSCPSTARCFAVSWGIDQPMGLTGP